MSACSTLGMLNHPARVNFNARHAAVGASFAHLRAARDLDLVGDAELPGHPGRGIFGGGPLSAGSHRTVKKTLPS
jgi:hypothetical protein